MKKILSPIFCWLLSSLFLLDAQGQTIWDGPKIVFTKNNSADISLAENQDRISPNVWLTRGDESGLFNIKLEASYTRDVSPMDTEWSFGTSAEISNLTFADWRTAISGNPLSAVGQDMVLHLISEDIYLDIKFLNWEQQAGGFSYERSSNPETRPDFSVQSFSLIDAANNQISRAIASNDQIDVSDFPQGFGIVANTDPEQVGSVRFFLNDVLVRNENVAPYSINGDANNIINPLDLAPGNYLLTAIPYAGKNGGGEEGQALTLSFEVLNGAPRVMALVLVDATNNQELGPIQEGQVIDLSSFPNGFGILAKTNPDQVGSVRFFVDSVLFRNENVAPYSINGDENDIINPVDLPVGNYHLTAISYEGKNGSGQAGQGLTRNFEIRNNLPQITELSLVNTSNNQIVRSLIDADVIELSDFPDGFGIVAKTSPEEVGSVQFFLNNGAFVRNENVAPYSINGDENGKINPVDLPPGFYTLTAIAFTGKGGAGAEGSSFSIDIEVRDTQIEVSELLLFDATNNEALGPISEGQVIELSSFPDGFGIVAKTSPEQVGSVQFLMDSVLVRNENVAPYSINGDANNIINPVDLPTGNYHLTAIPYSDKNGGGAKGKELTVSFLILEGVSGEAIIRISFLDTQNEVAGFKNLGDGSLDISNYWICLGPGAYNRLGDYSSIQGDFDLSPGEEVLINLPSGSQGVPALPDDEGGLGLFSSPSFSTSSPLFYKDYVQWGGANQNRFNQAVFAGRWPNGEDFVGGSSPFVFDGGATDIGSAFWQAANLSDLLIYPNPSEGEIFIRSLKDAEVEIKDSKGRLIFRGELDKQGKALQLPAGRYFIQSPGGIVKRVIIK